MYLEQVSTYSLIFIVCDIYSYYKLISYVSAFQEIYDRLDVTITEKGESFYHDMMLDVVKFLEAGGESFFFFLICNYCRITKEANVYPVYYFFK
jgi:hypothetical protein